MKDIDNDAGPRELLQKMANYPCTLCGGFDFYSIDNPGFIQLMEGRELVRDHGLLGGFSFVVLACAICRQLRLHALLQREGDGTASGTDP